MSDTRRFVYNPCDDDEVAEFTFNAYVFKLAPNAVTELVVPPGPRFKTLTPNSLALQCMHHLAVKGVVVVSGFDVDATTIEKSEEAHADYLRRSYARVVTDFDRERKEATEMGLTPSVEPARVASLRKRLTARGVLAGLLALLLAPGAVTQQISVALPIMALYDLDSATETFCAFDPKPQAVLVNVVTTASSATVTGIGAQEPFADVAVNDQLLIGGPLPVTRTVIARASASSITVDSVLVTTSPATGYPFQYRKLRCSTDGTTGSFSVAGAKRVIINFTIAQQNTTTGIDVRLQCRVGDSNAAWVQRYPALTPPAVTATYTTFTSTGFLDYDIPDPPDRCRLGVKLNTTDDGGDLTTNREQVSATAQVIQ